MRYLAYITISLLITIHGNSLKAQGELQMPNLRLYLSEDRTSYAGLLMVNQIWSRYTWNNPDLSGASQNGDFDMGLRRSRVILYTSLMDKVFMYTQLGTDGLSFRSVGSPAVSLFNAQTEYILLKNKIHIGFGLNTWNGVSRYNNSKLLDFLVVDSPGFAYPIGGSFDRFGRQFGLYAKGTLSNLHYRVSVVKPFETGVDSSFTGKTVERLNNNLAVKGYFIWHFLETENQLLPYLTMNNLGKSRLLNLGAGFYYHPEGMTGITNGLINNYNIFLAALDVFLDIPLSNKGALTSYLGYFYYNFGPDFLKSAGMMNVAQTGSGSGLPQGIGNSQWEIGTGQIFRWEAGYLLPGKLLNSGIQPFMGISRKDFEALDQPSFQYDLGLNILRLGHNIKWTAQYSTRPVYYEVNGSTELTEYKGQLLVQTQIFF